MDARVKTARWTENPDGRNRRLARIADITGVAIDAFFSDAADAASFQELIRLWDETGDAAGRAEILACARAVAARSAARSRDGAA